MQKPQALFVNRMNEKVIRVMKVVIALLVAAFMTVTFIQTVLRYVFHGSLWWSEEVARYFFVWTIMLGVNVAIMEKQMLRLEFVDTLLSKSKVAVIDIIVTVIGWLFIAFLLYSSILYFQTLNANQLAPTLGWQMRYVTLCMPIGTGLSLWAQTVTLIEKLHIFRNGRHENSNEEVAE